MVTWRKRLALVAVVAVTASVLAAAAGAAGAPLTVKGTQTVVNENKGIFKMHGSLVGTWYTLSWLPHYQSSTQIAATGKERFVGCLDSNRNGSCDMEEPAGTLTFSYTYWASFKNGGKTLVRGACVHPILSGTKGFAGAKGVLFMKDTPAAGGPRTTYTGTLDLERALATQRVLSSSAAGSC